VTSRPAVDVLIPSLDRPGKLRRALASVEAVQRAEPGIEIRPQVIDRAQGSAAGPAAARNRAAAQGHAEYIAFLDDDDEWLAPRLGAAIEVLATRPDVALIAGDAELTSGGRFLKLSRGAEEDHSHRALSLDCFVCTSTVTMRRKDFEAMAGMSEDLWRAEDYDLWLRLTRGGRRVHLIRESIARYEDTDEGLSSDPLEMARSTLTALERSAAPQQSLPWNDRLGRLEAVVSHGLSKSGKGTEGRSLAFQALRHSPRAKVAWTSVFRSFLPLAALTILATFVALTCAPTAAQANGFGRLEWGMSRSEVVSAYPGQTLESDSARSRPSGTEGGVLRVLEDTEIFGLTVGLEAHFHHDKLAVLRLTFLKRQQSNLDKVLEIYSSSAGVPLRSIRAKRGRKTTTWSWPWEGLELRSVSDGGELKYQRLDISQGLQRRWLSADAAVCSILPGSSSCNLEHRFCPSSDTDPKNKAQQHSLDVAGKQGEVTCSYEEQELTTISLAIPKASDVTVDWLELIFESRLGEGARLRDARGSSTVQLRTAWEEHGVEMLVVRKAYVETKNGWTGPVEFLRIRRVVTDP